MSSLLDKLRAAQPIRKAEAPVRRADGCLIKTQDHPCRDFPAMPLSPDTLRLMAAFAAEEHLRPEDLLFLDTETTGLKGGAGTVAFLIGLGRFEGERFVVTQFLMRDYDEEPFVLTPVLEALGRCKAVVTFNGASFDMPLLQTRLIMNRLHQGYEAPPNLDLLHIARRVYKLRVRQCTLGRLEEEVFGTPRVDDLPGSQVPERYFEYIRTRELALLDDILAHNAQDILSMARLLYALAHLHEQPLSAQDQRDLYSLGRVFERRGERERAGQCFRACDDRSVRELAQMRLANLLRRDGGHDEAAGLYEQARVAGRGGAKVYIELAKIYEHRFRAPGRALAIARQGMLYCLERLDEGGADSPEYKDLAHRVNRLIAKTGGKTDGITGRHENTFRAEQASEGGRAGGQA